MLPLRLLSPGVVRSPPTVLAALAYQHEFMHRQEPFHGLHQTYDQRMLELVVADSSLRGEYQPMIVTGSGTSSMDTVINAFVSHGPVLFVSNGMFGERWIEIGKFYNAKNALTLRHAWGDELNATIIAHLAQAHGAIAVIVVHCDTSVGILNNIKEIGLELKRVYPSAAFVVDAVSSLAAVPIDMPGMNISVLVSNPNKGLAAHMGIGIIVARHNVMGGLAEEKCGSYSLNLVRNYKLAKAGETCNSVSISAINALLVSLKELNVQAQISKFKSLWDIMYDALGDSFLLTKEHSCPAIVTIMDSNANETIRRLLEEHRFVVYPCKNHLDGKGFQVSFYGQDGTIENIRELVSAIQAVQSSSSSRKTVVDK